MFGPILPGSRGTLMLDVVALAMLAVVPVLTFSIVQIRYRRNVKWHSTLQKWIGAALLVTVILFEIDVRLQGWTAQAKLSPYYDSLVFPVLSVHLVFAISTALLWLYVLPQAIRHKPRLDSQDLVTRRHRRFGMLTTVFTYLTAATGWTFYWLAFIA